MQQLQVPPLSTDPGTAPIPRDGAERTPRRSAQATCLGEVLAARSSGDVRAVETTVTPSGLEALPLSSHNWRQRGVNPGFEGLIGVSL